MYIQQGCAVLFVFSCAGNNSEQQEGPLLLCLLWAMLGGHWWAGRMEKVT